MPAVSDNNYVTVWNNDTVDGSFGVTSPIYLTDVDPHSGRVLNRLPVPTGQVVTSFSSKSELALHLGQDRRGTHLVFVGYAERRRRRPRRVELRRRGGPGPDQSGDLRLRHRLCVPPHHRLAGRRRAPLLYADDRLRRQQRPRGAAGLERLYYTVGNANNGNAATFGPPATAPIPT